MEKQQFIDFAFIKQHADFEKVLYQLTARRSSGKQLSVLCPFHDDTQPSLKVTPQQKSFHCFGCGAKGNILDFVRDMENSDLRSAAEILATICRIDLAPPQPMPSARLSQVQRPEEAVECVFRGFRRAISLESGRRFRCKAAPFCEGFSVPASTYRC